MFFCVMASVLNAACSEVNAHFYAHNAIYMYSVHVYSSLLLFLIYLLQLLQQEWVVLVTILQRFCYNSIKRSRAPPFINFRGQEPPPSPPHFLQCTPVAKIQHTCTSIGMLYLQFSFP